MSGREKGGRRRFLLGGMVALLYASATLLLTWPLSAHLGTHLPLGSEGSATVPLFNLWTMLWNRDRLLEGYASYWQAPIFHPTNGAFAFSDPQPATGAIFALLHLLAGNAVLAHNVLLLLTLTLNGLSAFLFARVLGIARGAALLGGFVAISLPFTTRELGVLQLTPLYPIFLALTGLLLLSKRGGPGAALLLGCGVALAYLTSGYYGIFLSLFVATGVLLLVRWGRGGRRRSLLMLLLAATVILVLTVPSAAGQVRYAGDLQRSDSTITRTSAQPADYLRLDENMWGNGVLPWLRTSGGSGQRLYPGTLLLALAIPGALIAWRQNRRRWLLFSMAGIAGAFILSLGLNLQVGGISPYGLVRELVPGFGQLRSPFRIGLFVHLFLWTLALFALDWLWRWRPPWGRLFAVGLVLVSLIELASLPARLYEFPHAAMHEPWLDWLAGQPTGAVAMIPFAASGRAVDFEPTALAMLQGLEHGHPLLNGYSGFFPATYRGLRIKLSRFPEAEAISALEEQEVRYLVITAEAATSEARIALDLNPGWHLLYEDIGKLIYGRGATGQ